MLCPTVLAPHFPGENAQGVTAQTHAVNIIHCRPAPCADIKKAKSCGFPLFLHNAFSNTAVLVSSAERALRGKEVGFCAYLLKPVDLSKLNEAIAQGLVGSPKA